MTRQPTRGATAPRKRALLRPALVYSAALLVTLFTVTLVQPVVPEASASQEGSGQGKLLLVLDSSGSMKEPSGDGRTRFQAAVSSMKEVVDSLPADVEVGLRVYGSTIPDGPGSCRDSELVVPVKTLDRSALKSALDKARPLGNTPIAYSLEQAAQDLPDEGQRTIVLISDGEESCGGDPCQVARDLSKQGLNLRVDVVGFQVDAKARDQLTCIAQAGRGTFYDAPNAGALTGQLSRLSTRAARAYAPAGLPVEGTPAPAGAPELKVGQYLDTIGDGDQVETYSVTPTTGNTLYVTATVRPTTTEAFDSEQFDLRVSAADANTCGLESEVSFGLQDRLTPVSVVASFSGEELKSCGPAPYAVSVERKDGSNVSPLEVLVVEEPPVSGTSGLPDAARAGAYDVRKPAGGKPTRTAGAPSFTAAPILEPGVYTDSILAGERLYYGVDLAWGQQLVCDVSFGENAALANAADFGRGIAKLGVYGPTRAEIGGNDFAFVADVAYEATGTVTPHIATPPVRYLNRDGDPAMQPASMAGTYYCGALMSVEPALSKAGEIPMTVRLNVIGEPMSGPEYVAPVPEEETPSPSASPSADESGGAGDAGDSTESAGEQPDESGVSPWIWVLALMVLVGVGIVGWLARRRAAP